MKYKLHYAIVKYIKATCLLCNATEEGVNKLLKVTEGYKYTLICFSSFITVTISILLVLVVE